jgi:hypothetical protein
MSPFLPRRFALEGEQATAMKSRVNREVHARFCEGLGVKFPGVTRRPELWIAASRRSMRALAIYHSLRAKINKAKIRSSCLPREDALSSLGNREENPRRTPHEQAL